MVTGFVLNPCRKNLTDTRRFHAHVDDLRNDVPLPSAIVKTRQQCVVVLIVQVSALARNSVSSGMPNHTLSTTQNLSTWKTVFSKYWVDHTTKNKAVTRGSHIHQQQR